MKRVYIADGRFYLADNLNKHNAYLLSTGKAMINPIIYEVPKDAIVSDIVDGQFSEMAYNERKASDKVRRYENLVESLIRRKYSLNAEIAILRQRDTKLLEYAQYNEYAEQCKAQAKKQLNYDL